MKQRSTLPTDPDLLGADAALRRAAVNAKKLAKQQGTPYVAYKVTDKNVWEGIVETEIEQADWEW